VVRALTRIVSLEGMDEEVVPVLYVEDAGRAVSWYERLGFVKEWEHQFEPGFPWFVSRATEVAAQGSFQNTGPSDVPGT